MKKLICVLLACALGFALPVLAADAQPVEPVLVTYDSLAELVSKNNPAVQAVAQEYKKLDIQLKSMQGEHKDLMDADINNAAAFASAIQLQQAMREIKVELARQDFMLNMAAGQQLYAARRMYVGYFVLAQQVKLAASARDGAQQQLLSLQRQYNVGLASLNSVENAKNILKGLEESLLVAQHALEVQLIGLSNMLGIGGSVKLEELPQPDFEAIMLRDYEADLAAYTLSAPEVQAKKLAWDKAADAKSLSDKMGSAMNAYAVEVARADYQLAQATAARSFPLVYQKLLDEYSRYTSSVLVPDAKRKLEAAAQQYGQGLISRNQLEAAQRALANAESTRRLEELELYLSLLEYEYNLILWE